MLKKHTLIMKQKAMDGKLVVRPLIGCLTHTHLWEGPCRAGHEADMTVEAETKAIVDDIVIDIKDISEEAAEVK